MLITGFPLTPWLDILGLETNPTNSSADFSSQPKYFRFMEINLVCNKLRI